MRTVPIAGRNSRSTGPPAEDAKAATDSKRKAPVGADAGRPRAVYHRKLPAANHSRITNHQYVSRLTDPAEAAEAAGPGAEAEVRGVDSQAVNSHAVAVAVVFLAGPVPRVLVLAKHRASSEKPGLARPLMVKGILPARRPVSATPLATGSETPSPKGMQQVKPMLVVRPMVLVWKRPIAKRSPKAKERPLAKAHLLLSIRPKGRIEGHRRRQWLS